jgi:coenzyme PQQ precursor peptide PqqA
MRDNLFSLVGRCGAGALVQAQRFISKAGREEAAVKETWSKPQVTEQEAGLEVTSYVAAEIEDT